MELYQIDAPTTRILWIGLGVQASTEEPRLLLEDLSGPGKPLNMLEVLIPAAPTPAERLKLWEMAEVPHPPARAGTWTRYREDVNLARRLIAVLGWQLNEYEEGLLTALESYGAAA